MEEQRQQQHVQQERYQGYSQGEEEPSQEVNSVHGDSTSPPALQLQANHAAMLSTTEAHLNTRNTLRAHNLKIRKIIEWLRKEYPTVASSMIVPLTQEQKHADGGLKFYKNEYDLQYATLPVEMIKAFIAANKIKSVDANGAETHYSFDQLRKYKDAILYGAKRAKYPLSPGFKQEMKVFIDSLKKESQKAKKEGKVDEHEADPITFPLYQEMCQAAIKTGNVFFWCFTVLQWNCMARSINISNLRFNSFSLGKDSVKIKYWDTKKDKTGEKATPKNCYANPYNYVVCFNTALAVYLIIMDETFRDGRETLFLSPKAQESSASQKYCSQVKEMFRSVIPESVAMHIRPNHANAHGIRKGSAVEVTSGTTCPPPPSSVARRGEWSLGVVFDIYWLFAEAGDYYCGRILAGLNPNTSSFEVLPPHFIVGSENLHVNEALNMCFPNISKLNGMPNIKGLLLRCLASVIYHSEALIQVIDTEPGHPFSQIPILSQRLLLKELKGVVTINPSPKINSPTGKVIFGIQTCNHLFCKLINQNELAFRYPSTCQNDEPGFRNVGIIKSRKN